MLSKTKEQKKARRKGGPAVREGSSLWVASRYSKMRARQQVCDQRHQRGAGEDAAASRETSCAKEALRIAIDQG
jgi:hypothetical protein